MDEKNKEDVLFVGLDKHEGERTMLMISRKTNNKSMEIVNVLYDEEAEELYKKLIRRI